MAQHSTATFWYVLPFLPVFLLISMLLNKGAGFWPALITGFVLTIGLYLAMTWASGRLGFRL